MQKQHSLLACLRHPATLVPALALGLLGHWSCSADAPASSMKSPTENNGEGESATGGQPAGRGGASGMGGALTGGEGGTSTGSGGTLAVGTGGKSGTDGSAGAGGEPNARDAAGSSDASPPAPAGPPPPPPTMPPALPGMVLWLDAGKGVLAAGGKVSRWTDQSPAKNDAFMDSAGSQPTIVMGATGFPSVHFSGKRDPKNAGGDGGPYLRLKDNDSLNWGTGDWMIQVVTAYDNALDGTHNGAFGTFYGKYGTKVEILFSGNWPLTEKTEHSALHIGFGEGGTGFESKRKELNDNKVRVFGARRKGTTLELRINGKVDSSRGGAGANLDMPGIDVGIGSFSGRSGTRGLKGDIYLIMAVKGPTDEATVKTLEDYLVAHFKAAP